MGAIGRYIGMMGSESRPDKTKCGVNSVEHGVDGRGLCC